MVLIHLAARRPLEAVRLSARAIEAGAVALGRVYVRFAYTGQTQELRAFLDADRGALDPEYRIHLTFRTLCLEQRFHELEQFLAPLCSTSVRVGISFIGLMLAGIGRRPVAEFCGWTYLLLGDSARSAECGRLIRDFLEEVEQTGPNKWFPRLLGAEAALFSGDLPLAAREARAAVALVPRTLDAVAFVEGVYMAANVLAWSNQEQEAVDLLEELTSATPGLGPGFITLDPICSVPLSRNARYQGLASRLMREMRTCAEELHLAAL
jgi:hypothetical protein